MINEKYHMLNAIKNKFENSKGITRSRKSNRDKTIQYNTEYNRIGRFFFFYLLSEMFNYSTLWV